MLGPGPDRVLCWVRVCTVILPSSSSNFCDSSWAQSSGARKGGVRVKNDNNYDFPERQPCTFQSPNSPPCEAASVMIPVLQIEKPRPGENRTSEICSRDFILKPHARERDQTGASNCGKRLSLCGRNLHQKAITLYLINVSVVCLLACPPDQCCPVDAYCELPK